MATKHNITDKEAMGATNPLEGIDRDHLVNDPVLQQTFDIYDIVYQSKQDMQKYQWEEKEAKLRLKFSLPELFLPTAYYGMNSHLDYKGLCDGLLEAHAISWSQAHRRIRRFNSSGKKTAEQHTEEISLLYRIAHADMDVAKRARLEVDCFIDTLDDKDLALFIMASRSQALDEAMGVVEHYRKHHSRPYRPQGLITNTSTTPYDLAHEITRLVKIGYGDVMDADQLDRLALDTFLQYLAIDTAMYIEVTKPKHKTVWEAMDFVKFDQETRPSAWLRELEPENTQSPSPPDERDQGTLVRPSQSQSEVEDNSQPCAIVSCYFCGKNHYVRGCPYRPRRRGSNNKANQQN